MLARHVASVGHWGESQRFGLSGSTAHHTLQTLANVGQAGDFPYAARRS